MDRMYPMVGFVWRRNLVQDCLFCVGTWRKSRDRDPLYTNIIGQKEQAHSVTKACAKHIVSLCPLECLNFTPTNNPMKQPKQFKPVCPTSTDDSWKTDVYDPNPTISLSSFVTQYSNFNQLQPTSLVLSPAPTV